MMVALTGAMLLNILYGVNQESSSRRSLNSQRCLLSPLSFAKLDPCRMNVCGSYDGLLCLVGIFMPIFAML
jgi:hypothetical protein